MASYREGSIAVTNGSKTVTGTNTLWQNYGIQQGDQLYLVDANELQTGSMYEVASVTDNTHLTLLQNYQGTTASGKAYAILNTAGNQTLPAVAARLANFMTELNGVPSSTQKGLVKLYSALGTNTDGALTQAAAKTAIDLKIDTSKINANSGVAGLDASGKLVTQKLYTNTANNVAGLDSNAKVPIANLPVVGTSDSHIMEVGENANGIYLKFYNGLLIMYGYFSVSNITFPNTYSTTNLTYSEDITINYPVPIFTGSKSTLYVNAARPMSVVIRTISNKNYANVCVLCHSGAASISSTSGFHYLVVATWK